MSESTSRAGRLKAAVDADTDFLNDLGRRPADSWTGQEVVRLWNLALALQVQFVQSETQRHVHTCMSCSKSWFCPHPQADCKAGENVMPSLILRGPDGPTVFRHECQGKK